MKLVAVQLRAELCRVAANGEQLLLTLGIPVMLLVFFSLVDVLPTDTKEPIDFLAPGILALAGAILASAKPWKPAPPVCLPLPLCRVLLAPCSAACCSARRCCCRCRYPAAAGVAGWWYVSGK